MRGRPPGKDNPEAHELAEELFTATGGPGQPGAKNSTREWRQHFRAAARTPQVMMAYMKGGFTEPPEAAAPTEEGDDTLF